MIIPFDKIPKESRVWIYQSNRKFSDKEITEITLCLMLHDGDGVQRISVKRMILRIC